MSNLSIENTEDLNNVSAPKQARITSFQCKFIYMCLLRKFYYKFVMIYLYI